MKFHKMGVADCSMNDADEAKMKNQFVAENEYACYIVLRLPPTQVLTLPV